MSIKITKRAYMKLIDEDLDWLNNKCPAGLEKRPYKNGYEEIKTSTIWWFPDKREKPQGSNDRE